MIRERRKSGPYPAARRGERRAADPSFSRERWLRALITSDTGFAEWLLGGWVVAMRGVMLSTLGFTLSQIADFLAHWSLTADRLGFLLISVGVAQVIAPGTEYRRWRGIIAACGAMICVTIGLAYAAEHRAVGTKLGFTLAYTWWSLAFSEVVLAIRIFLNEGAETAAAAANGGTHGGTPHDAG